MIKVSVMYPSAPGARFDHDYYRDTHMPLIQRLLGEACSFYEIDKGLSGGEARSVPTYVGMCHIVSPSIESFQGGMALHGAAILAEIANYTDLVPLIQVSEVVIGPPDRTLRGV